MNDTQSHSVNIARIFRPKTRNGQKFAQKPYLGFFIIKAAASVCVSSVYSTFHDKIHIKPYKFHLWQILRKGCISGKVK